MMDESCEVKSRESYICVGCNRKPLCLDWGQNGLVAFGAQNSVALYQPKLEKCAGKVKCLLYGHKGVINCVKWISKYNRGDETELVSGSVTSETFIWRYFNDKWVQHEALNGHSGAIIALAALTVSSHDNDCKTLVATASADSTIRIWERTSLKGSFTCSESIDLNGGFAFCLALSTLPATTAFLLACGREDATVHLYTKVDSQFANVMKLVGHEDWIRSVDFVEIDSGDVMLASGSQDGSVRMWRFVQKLISANSPDTDCPNGVNSDASEDLVLTCNEFTATWKGSLFHFSVVLETILLGHEGWVYGVRWHPKITHEGRTHQPLCVMSSSMDKTIVMWKFDEQSGMWIDEVRVGDVGGNTLGFYGASFSPDGECVLAYSYQGALHMWRKQPGENTCTSWQAISAPSGHYGPVQDIGWDPEAGEFLISLSSDQTTRIHAPWRREGYETTWHEIGRPQIHGYNMQCLAMISRYCFASGADEKVIRVFEAPKSFAEKFTYFCHVQDKNVNNFKSLGASVPVLGLSNKAVFDDDLANLKKDLDDPQRPMKASAFASEEPAPFTPFVSRGPPEESNLLQNTLWPETQKLYGHGYEIFALAFNPSLNILASSCKASKAEHANILLWDTLSWQIVGSLQGHTLTIIQMEFSNSGKYLLSVSRDRTWCLFEQQTVEKKVSYQLVARSDKKVKVHTRVIWSCAWAPDDLYFFTASRDKKVVSWSKQDDNTEKWLPASNHSDVGEAATAVAVSYGALRQSCYLVSVGTESGKIFLYNWSPVVGWNILTVQGAIMCHTATIKRLRWRPSKEQCHGLQLASCSMDNCVKIHEISARLGELS